MLYYMCVCVGRVGGGGSAGVGTGGVCSLASYINVI